MEERKTIYLCLAHMSEDGFEQKYVKEAFDTNWVVPMGPNVNAFEQNLADFANGNADGSKLNRKVVCLSAGTAAVHLDIYDDRIVLTSPGGMYNGLMVQDLNLDDISSDRRNPVLADVMAQLDYMEKRGSGLRRIFSETQRLDSYRDDRHPVFRSNASQFITTLYSMDYDSKEGPNPALSWHQVSTKLALSWYEMAPLMKMMVDYVSAKDLREAMGWKDSTKFKKKFRIL